MILKDSDGEVVCEEGPIAVAPTAQGTGLGSRMLNEMEQIAIS